MRKVLSTILFWVSMLNYVCAIHLKGRTGSFDLQKIMEQSQKPFNRQYVVAKIKNMSQTIDKKQYWNSSFNDIQKNYLIQRALENEQTRDLKLNYSRFLMKKIQKELEIGRRVEEEQKKNSSYKVNMTEIDNQIQQEDDQFIKEMVQMEIDKIKRIVVNTSVNDCEITNKVRRFNQVDTLNCSGWFQYQNKTQKCIQLENGQYRHKYKNKYQNISFEVLVKDGGLEIKFNKTKEDDCGRVGLSYFNGVNQLENAKYKSQMKEIRRLEQNYHYNQAMEIVKRHDPHREAEVLKKIDQIHKIRIKQLQQNRLAVQQSRLVGLARLLKQIKTDNNQTVQTNSSNINQIIQTNNSQKQ